MKNYTKMKQIVLLTGDIVLLYASLYLALLIRNFGQISKESWATHLGPFTVIFFLWILIFYIGGLYNLHLAISNIQFLKVFLNNVLFASVIALTFFYLAPQTGISPKTSLVICVFIYSVLFILWRKFFYWLIKSYLPKKNIAIIGFNKQVEELIGEIQKKPHLGYAISFVVGKQQNDVQGVSIIKQENLREAITEMKINTIILATDPNESLELRSGLFNCLSLNINFINLPHFYENLTGRVPIETISQSWFLENLSEGSKDIFNISKRIFDILFALLILLGTILAWPIIGLIIKIESKGPIFFKQIRAGKNNKPFTILKFRSMSTTNNDASPTVANDARVTKFGSLLRKTRLDEIPQVINILKGEMSFVGPRPERPELIKNLEAVIPFYNERMLVKPGATGWDQISGEYHSPSREDTLKKLQYDLFYIKNRSIYLDLSIILKTLSTIFSRTGR